MNHIEDEQGKKHWHAIKDEEVVIVEINCGAEIAGVAPGELDDTEEDSKLIGIACKRKNEVNVCKGRRHWGELPRLVQVRYRECIVDT